MERSLNKAFLLTAGVGSRLRPYTNNTPKPALPFLELPLVSYCFFMAHQSGIRDFLFNVHHLSEKMVDCLKNFEAHADSLTILDESKELLGSGGALWNARDILEQEDCFLIINGDELLIPTKGNPLVDLYRKYSETQPLACLLTTDHPDLFKTLKPMWVDRGGYVTGFGMKPPTPESQPVHYVGHKIFNKKILDLLPEGQSSIFTDVIVQEIAKGTKIPTYHSNDFHWYHSGTPEEFTAAAKDIYQLAKNGNQYLKELFEFYGHSLETINTSFELVEE